jgi:hypothetical protein
MRSLPLRRRTIAAVIGLAIAVGAWFDHWINVPRGAR